MFTLKKKLQHIFILFIIIPIFLTSCSSNMNRFTSIVDLKENRNQKITNENESNLGNNSINPSGQWTVNEGDTIELISEKTNVSIEDIAYFNSLKFPYELKKGMSIYIGNNSNNLGSYNQSNYFDKDSMSSQRKNNIDVYIVEAGDTISSISNRFDVDANILIRINNIDNPQLIKIGQSIKLKEKNNSSNIDSLAKDEINNIKPILNINEIKKEEAIIKEPQFRWPIYGRVLNNFGDEVYNRINNGIYISAPAGSDVSVSESGVVTFVGKEEYFGNIIIVKHPNNWVSSYAHMGDVNVIIGDKIKKGQIIGDVGMTGIINSPQLYFEIRRGTIVQNPLDFLD